MKKNLLKSFLMTVALVLGTTGAWADEITATLVHTASSYCENTAGTFTSTVDAEKETVNNKNFAGTWAGAAYADFSFAIPEGQTVQSATLTFTGVGEKRNTRNTDVMYVNADATLDYDALSAGDAKVDLAATTITSVSFPKGEGATTEFTVDATDAVKAMVTAGKGGIIFKLTNNPGGGALKGKGSDVAPTLVITTVSASAQTSYTVKFTDEAGNELKEAAKYDVLIGNQATASAEDMAAFFNADNTMKYIYVSGNQNITAAENAESNIITLVFREAAKYSYTLVSDLGNELVKGEDWEGNTVQVNYPRHLLADQTLYTAGKGSAGYYLTEFALTEDNMTQTISYTAGESGIVFLSEAEDIATLTVSTAANSKIRCSNGICAYNAGDKDAVLATVPAGVYKLYTSVWGNATTDFIFKAGESQILSAASMGYIADYTSEEFTVNWNTPITLAATDNAGRGIDFVYIQKVGEAEELPDPNAPRVWNFDQMNEADEALLAAEVEKGNWTVSKNRYQNANVAFNNEVIAIEGTELDVTKGLLFTAEANKLLLGSGVSGSNHFMQIQKGTSFTITGLTAGDTVRAVVQSASKAAVTLETPANVRVVEGFEAVASKHTCTLVMKKDGDLTLKGINDIRFFTLEAIKAELLPMEDIKATINFNDSTDYATSSNGVTDGDILENKTITAGALTLTVTPSGGSTPNRIWSTSNGPQLRVYGGKVLFDVPEGYAIKAVAISQQKWNAENTFNGVTAAESKWEGNSTNVVLGIKANTQINSIEVTINEADDNTTTYVDMTKAANIAAMKALENGTEAQLTLTDAKVTSYYGTNSNMYSIIEDATGAIKVDASISGMISAGEGCTLNGTLTAMLQKEESGICTLNVSENTEMTFTATEGTVTPAVITLEALAADKEANLLKYVKLEDVDIEMIEDDYGNKEMYLAAGETKLLVNDCYWMFPESMPEFVKFKSIAGFMSADNRGNLEFNPYGEDYVAETKPATVVENIAALKQLENGTYAKLTLTNAQIKVCEPPMMGWGAPIMFLEDETAGIQIDNMSDALLEKFTELGQTFTGTLYCRYLNEYGQVAIGESDSTRYSDLTIGTAEVVAKEVSISEATSANYDCRLITIKGVATQAPGEGGMWPVMVKGGKTLPMMDMFGKFPSDETGYVFYNKCQVTGIIMQGAVSEDETTGDLIMGDIFIPTEIVETPQVYKSIEATYTLLPTEENVTAAAAEGWVEAGGTYTTNKKGHFNPETGEALDKATTMPGVGLKKGNAAKSFVTYVTGATKLVAYAVSTSSVVRGLVVTATAEDGTVVTASDSHDSTESNVVELELDKTKKYAIEYTGVDESGDNGADICLYGVRFEVGTGTPTGIENVNSTVNVLGSDVYTVNGVKVRNAGESLEGLAKGLYIIGGKKVVVK